MDDDIREIATSIWETLFRDPLERGGADAPVSEPAVTGCVTIEGAWNGAVLLTCDQALAQSLAAELFKADAPQDADVRDTVGELTNMLAGNIKALLPEPSRISLPTVALGADYDLTVPGTHLIATVPFRCRDRAVEVTVRAGGAEGGA
jgi:chemotaxis protein CheX